MRFRFLADLERNLARGAAVAMLGGLAAGCSASAVRFDSVDAVFTGSTTKNQQEVIRPVGQPFPADKAPGLDAAPTGSVNRAALEPVNVTARNVETAALDPVGRKPLGAAAGVDNTLTGSVAPQAAVPADQPMPEIEEPAGWSRAGGTQVRVKEGETIYNLSRRFGVPANVIARVNGISEGGTLQAGQKLVIPTYVYSAKAPISAPDSNPKVADAKSSRGTKHDLPANVPVPSSPGERVAVLPAAPKLREGDAAAVEAPKADANTGKKAAGAGTYTVASGDTLSRIAKQTGVSVPKIKAANGLQDGILRIGQTLKIPGGEAGAVAKAETPAGVDPTITGAAGPSKPAKATEIAGYTPPKPDKVMVEAESDPAEAPDSTGIGRMRWPVKGRVVSAYGKGNGKPNDGIDIAVPEGTPVKAAENGVVIYAGDGLKEFGNTVLVRHEDGLVTVYGHNGDLKVTRGQKVKRGEQLATSGMSGSAKSPMLHFEVRKDSAPVDPSAYLN
jgi:murein DD-endopeptidase MepM/ murein hydrolase activator NlpD